jgi:hypothetical protein
VITFNDFKGTTKQIVLTPAALAAVNSFSCNLGYLGDNRGRGLQPSAVE